MPSCQSPRLGARPLKLRSVDGGSCLREAWLEWELSIVEGKGILSSVTPFPFFVWNLRVLHTMFVCVLIAATDPTAMPLISLTHGCSETPSTSRRPAALVLRTAFTTRIPTTAPSCYLPLSEPPRYSSQGYTRHLLTPSRDFA